MSVFGDVLNSGLKKVFGSKYERDLKTVQPLVDEINEHFAELFSLSDDELKGKTEEFKRRLNEGETTDDIMTEAFAVVKETCRRLMGQKWMVMGHETEWNMIPYDCQLIGAIVLHQGKIAEMATGEGKSLVSTMPLYLNSLNGKGAHFVTVNDYLVQRDVEWYGKIYEFLGQTVGYITNNSPTEAHKAAYQCDITYGTNNEFGFDYLRDNMAIREEDVVQNGFNYVLVDEVDSVLIDEARTPLIISGPVAASSHKYEEMKPLVYDIVKKQTVLVNSKIAEAEKLLDDDAEYDAGILLLQALRGTPKNKRLMKLLSERPDLKKLTMTVESDYMRDKKMNVIDEELLFVVDERHHTIAFTDKAINAMKSEDRKTFILPDINEEISQIEHDDSISDEDKIIKQEEITREFALKSEKIHNTNQLLKAYILFDKDKEYVVQDGKVLIVDEFTGRLMQGRRFSDGLHQALEAKENVKIERETQTFATITLQNYFRMYDKLSGMTGTAETEAGEFWDIYKLDVVVIPTNKPITRVDYNDQIYRTRREKFNAIIERIRFFHESGRPVLVGTVNVDFSETIARMLKRQGIRHNVLNAKQHDREAEIISNAGTVGAVTIATNMAGRGTDIKLDKVVKEMGANGDNFPGGLQIIGTERHEARRIDRQLRGRAGRQGDEGSTMFFLSLEDDLMRLFGSDRISGIMQSLGIEEGEVITHSMVTKAIDRAQKRVEAQNFSIRKHLLEYDNVMNSQREIIYGLRNTALRSGNVRERLFEMIEDVIDNLLEQYTDSSGVAEEWDMEGLTAEFLTIFFCLFKLTEEQMTTLIQPDLREMLIDLVKQNYLHKAEIIEKESLTWNERVILLSTIDELWKEHLYEMDQLKEGIGLRGYGQRDPLIEYKREGFILFENTLEQISTSTLKTLFRGVMAVQFEKAERKKIPEGKTTTKHDEFKVFANDNVKESSQALPPAKQETVKRDGKKVGRNEPCPCGSGKKYKQCHGKN
ncbi:preprotein translocase subunit SecA [Candidatus Latescibacterota bacterium]